MNYVPEQSLFDVEVPDVARVVATLLQIRSATAAAGNRRGLFAAMDELLAHAAGPVDDGEVAPMPSAAGGSSVRLRRIQLRNWKSFAKADLVVPETGADRQVVVIGGPNGFGKSSILEAFALGMFGRRALSDMGFLMNGTSGRGGQRRTYRSLMERSLHRSPRARFEGWCAVVLDFDTADGRINLERKWYFDDHGRLVEDEEELLVRVGNDRDLLETPTGVPPREWYQEEIERRLMPAGLAPFFVFDGEQVDRWAERRLSEQVRSAVGRMLGLEDLRGLADDLKAYARDRERGAGDGSADLGALQRRIEEQERELAAEDVRISEIDVLLAERRAMRDAAFASLAAASTGSHADLQGLLELEHRLVGDLARQRRELVGVMVDEGPLVLAGQALLDAAARSVDAAAGLAGVGMSADDAAVAWNRFVLLDPPLDGPTAAALRSRFKRAVAGEADAAMDTGAHGHLDRAGRRGVVTRISAAKAGRVRIRAASAGLADVAARLDEVRQRLADQERRSSERQDIQEELARLAAEIEAAEGQRGALRRHRERIVRELEPCRADLEARAALVREAEPRMRCAVLARSIAASVERHMSAVADGEYRRFGEAVTASFKALAHKDEVDRIEVRADGDVAMFDAQGRDVTDYRLSAGESQLFAMALIGAVGAIVGDRMPLIVDTPLSRLDTRHRESVLAMLGARRAQTLLLTQPEEVTARHLDMIRPVLAGSVRLEHAMDQASGVGVSTFADGYDPGIA